MEKAGLVFAIPTLFDLDENGQELVHALISEAADFNIAALRLKTQGQNLDIITSRADRLRHIAHEHEIAMVIDDQFSLAARLGLDGVHLTKPDAKQLRLVKSELDKDAIIGVFAEQSKHEGLVLGEIGCDYISFGPVTNQGLDTPIAPSELFAWWSEMIELPVIAEGNLTKDAIENLRNFVDFFALGEEVFLSANPLLALQECLAAIQA